MMQNPPFRVKALYEYASSHDDDLNFSSGQIITVTEQEDADWYYGDYVDMSGNTKQGIFPVNFVERLNQDEPSQGGSNVVSPSEARSRPDQVQISFQGLDKRAEEQSEAKRGVLPQEQAQGDSSLSKSTRAPQATTDSGSAPRNATTATPPRQQRSPSPDQRTIGSSFKDRIAAFNKPAAPPVAPFKPSSLSSGASGFIKRPFVPPPPSKNAYVPPPREIAQKIYRRESNEDSVAKGVSTVDPPGSVSTSSEDRSEDRSENQPDKPVTLKERIALLKRQQLEDASRRAEVVPKKATPAKPGKLPEETLDDNDNIGVAGGEEVPRGSFSDEAHNSIPLAISTDTESRDNSDNERSVTLSRDTHSRQVAEDTEDDAVIGNETRRQTHNDPPSLDPQTIDLVSGNLSANNGHDEDGGPEDNLDSEVRRKMELRERIAKMSGGIGMHGMLGVSPGIPHSSSSGRKKKEDPGAGMGEQRSPVVEAREPAEPVGLVTRAQPIPIMPLPSQSREHTPSDDGEEPAAVADDTVTYNASERDSDTESNVTGEGVETQKPAEAEDTQLPPPIPTGHHTSTSLDEATGPKASASPTEQDFLPPSSHYSGAEMSYTGSFRSVPPMTLTDTNNKASAQGVGLLSNVQASETRPDESYVESVKQHSGYRKIPPIPGSSQHDAAQGDTSVIPSSPPYYGASDDLLTASSTGPHRETTPPTSRAPPPAPPPRLPLTRQSTRDNQPVSKARMEDLPNQGERSHRQEEDHQTDPPPRASNESYTRKRAAPNSVVERGMGPASPNSAPSILPPPIPKRTDSSAQPEAPSRPSTTSDERIPNLPTAAPPPIPSRQPMESYNVDDYDPFRYSRPIPNYSADQEGPHIGPSTKAPDATYDAGSVSPKRLEHSRAFGPSQDDGSAPQPPIRPEHQASQAVPSTPTLQPPRQSVEELRTHGNIRRSMEQPRSSTERGFIAADVSLDRGSRWWAKPKLPPPAFQGRTDVIYEMEESSTSKRGGETTVSKEIYILYPDYSQSIVTARFDPKDEDDVTLEQRHEPPPPQLRQDQLEVSHTQFGRRLSEEASQKQGATVGDGKPDSLVTELLRRLPGALMPVGTRSYGVPIYVNLANASVKQDDEIRPGDIISFRNARFQGHRGPMHQKYNADVGKPDHVGIVVDWDGTKKKVRAWEQGRESKKVKMESFKLGDLRSGEVKIWRVVGRNWVGWDEQM